MVVKEGTHVADGGERGNTRCRLWQMVVKEGTHVADGGERGNTRCRLWQMVVKEGTHVADYDSLLPRSPLLNAHSRLQNEGSRTRAARSANHPGNQRVFLSFDYDSTIVAVCQAHTQPKQEEHTADGR